METGKYRKVALFFFPWASHRKSPPTLWLWKHSLLPLPFLPSCPSAQQLPRLMLSGDQLSISDCIPSACCAGQRCSTSRLNHHFYLLISLSLFMSSPFPSYPGTGKKSLQWNLNPINSKSCSFIMHMKSLPSLLFSWLIVTCRLWGGPTCSMLIAFHLVLTCFPIHFSMASLGWRGSVAGPCYLTPACLPLLSVHGCSLTLPHYPTWLLLPREEMPLYLCLV